MKQLKMIKQAVKSYRFNSIFIRNLLLIMLLILVPLLLASIYAYQKMNDSYRSQVQMLSDNNLQKTTENLEELITDTNRLATQLVLHEDIERVLFADKISTIHLNNAYNIIKMYAITYTSIESIYVYSSFHQHILTNQHFVPLSNHMDDTWLAKYEQLDLPQTEIYPRKQNNRYPYFLTFIRPVFLNEMDKVGAIVINLNVENLGELKTDQEEIYIVNYEDRIIFSPQLKKDFGKEADEIEKLAEYRTNSGGIQQNFIVANAELEGIQADVLSFLPLEVNQNEQRQTTKFLFVFFGISFLIAIILSFVISMYSYIPLKNLIAAFTEEEKNIATYRNELNYIESQISTIQSNEKSLSNQLEERLKKLKEAQTTALQAQTNPHFMSNTLETMKWMAMGFTKSENKLSQMIDSFSELLRLTLGSENSIITVKEELEIVQKYINIMQGRFRPSFEVEWDVDEELLSYKTIQLSLQPLVENALYHGLRELDRRPGKITVRVKHKVNQVYFEVSDNGVGMTEKQLNKLQENLKEISQLHGKHIGVRNVNDRLQLVFGEQYQLDVASKVNQGTVVSFQIPLIT